MGFTEAERGSARVVRHRAHIAHRLCVPTGIKLNPKCAMANILKRRGHAVPAQGPALDRTRRPIAEGASGRAVATV
jgi:hypothetical protein